METARNVIVLAALALLASPLAACSSGDASSSPVAEQASQDLTGCTPVPWSSCQNGTPVVCHTTADNVCITATARYGGREWACASCSDCTAAAVSAELACNWDTHGGGAPSSSGATPAPTTECATLKGFCTSGGPVKQCRTTSGSTCVAAYYEHDGQTFACNGCDDCAAAAASAQTACEAPPPEQCTSLKSFCPKGGPIQYCTTTVSGVCTGARYTHDGKSFSCASCGDCKGAESLAVADCESP